MRDGRRKEHVIYMSDSICLNVCGTSCGSLCTNKRHPLVNTQLTVSQKSTNFRRHDIEFRSIRMSRSTLNQLSTNCWSIVDQVSIKMPIEFWSRVERLLIGISIRGRYWSFIFRQRFGNATAVGSCIISSILIFRSSMFCPYAGSYVTLLSSSTPCDFSF